MPPSRSLLCEAFLRWRKGRIHKSNSEEDSDDERARDTKHAQEREHTERGREREPRCKRCEWRDVGGRWQQVVATEIARAKDRQARPGSVGAATTRSVLSKAPACPCAIQPQLTPQPVSTPLLPHSVTEYI